MAPRFLRTVPAAAVQAAVMAASAAGQRLEVVSFVGGPGLRDGEQSRSNLLSDLPQEVRVLSPNRTLPRWRNVFKLRLLHDHVARLPPETIVLALDFYDVVWLGCRRDLELTFLRFGRPIVFGAEVMPYPLSNESLQRLPGGYPLFFGRHHLVPAQPRASAAAPAAPARPPPPPRRPRLVRKRIFGKDGAGTWRRQAYRYLNAGCIAGYAGALRRATERMLTNGFANEYVLRTPLAAHRQERKNMLVGFDDQVAWHTYAIKHPDEIALDYFAELFLNVFGFSYDDFELTESGEVWARPFARAACLAHGNGATNVGVFLREAQQLGIQPWRCRHVSTTVDQVTYNTVDCAERPARSLSASGSHG